MPQMGESVTEGTILEWHVSEGEEVAEGDTVVEVSTDKIDAEVPAPASGVITKILAQPDDTVEVGQVLAQIDPNGTASGNGARPVAAEGGRGRPRDGRRRGRRGPRRRDVASESSQPGQIETPAPPSEPRAEPAAAPDAKRRSAGETRGRRHARDGRVGHRGHGARVARRARASRSPRATPWSRSRPTRSTPRCPRRRRARSPSFWSQPDDTVQVGQALAEMTAGAAAAAERRRRATSDRGASRETPDARGRRAGNGTASPVARRIAAAKGVDIGSVKGTGPGRQGGQGGRARAPPTATAPRRQPRRRGRGEAAARPRGDARQGDEREPRRCRPRPRSGRFRSTSSTRSARRSTGRSRSAG